jgi:hypothetical protein
VQEAGAVVTIPQPVRFLIDAIDGATAFVQQVRRQIVGDEETTPTELTKPGPAPDSASTLADHEGRLASLETRVAALETSSPSTKPTTRADGGDVIENADDPLAGDPYAHLREKDATGATDLYAGPEPADETTEKTADEPGEPESVA